MAQVTKDLVLPETRLIYRNFAGRKDKFNKNGNREFGAVIPTDLADQLVEEGWLVKCTPPRNEGDDPLCFLRVSLRFDIMPPKIYMVTSRGKTRLDEDTVGLLDDADILNSDLIVRPYNWEVDGETGTKAYVKSLWVTIDETPFDIKYADLPEAGAPEIETED